MTIKNRFTPKWNENAKQVLFAAFPIVFFAGTSLSLLIRNEPDWFARFGSLVVAWALVNLAVRRDQYSRHMWAIERGRLIRISNEQKKMRDWTQDSLNLTFDLHASQIAQINYELGRENPFVEANKKAITEFCHDVETRLERADWHSKSAELIKQSKELEDSYHLEIGRFDGWSKLIWRLEVVLVIWGTVQWGYGDLFVDWWHLEAQKLLSNAWQ